MRKREKFTFCHSLANKSTQNTTKHKIEQYPNHALINPQSLIDHDLNYSNKKNYNIKNKLADKKTNNKNANKNPITSLTFTLKADQDLENINILQLSNSNTEPKLEKITGMSFTWLSSEEIENLATVVVKTSKTSGPGSIYDNGFGTISNNEACPICGEGWRFCSGHPGVIKLSVSLPHPVRLNQIADILTCFCEFCHRLVLSEQKMRLLQLTKYHRENRFKAVLEWSKKKILRCQYCKKPHGKYSVVDDKFYKIYKVKGIQKRTLVLYDEVIEILLNIRQEEIRLLGFRDPRCHPKNMIISNLCVLPSCVRPYVDGGNGCMHDDLSYKYIEIMKLVMKLEDKNIEELERVKLVDGLMFHIKTLMDNNKGQCRDVHNKRSLRSIKQRLQGKTGLIRQNIQGKRTIQSARSVISPDANLDVNEVGVPRELAEKLTFPEFVNAININHCQKLLEDGKVTHIRRGEGVIDARYALWTRGFKLQYGDVIIRNGKRIILNALGYDFNLQVGDIIERIERTEDENGMITINRKIITNPAIPKRKPYKLKIGEIIERKLQDGDWTILNRQPTLHEPSWRAKRVRIHNDRTIKMDLGSTASFGGDFDGDEMNLFIACSHMSRIELESLMSTSALFISAADSKPMLVIKQDNMLAGYLYTLDYVSIPKHWFFDCCCIIEEWSIDMICKRIDSIRETYIRFYNETNNEINNSTVNNVTINKNDNVIDKNIDRLVYSGHGLLSVLFPDNFEFKFLKSNQNKHHLLIKRGVLLSGTITYPSLHHIIHCLYKDYGSEIACKFVTYYQRFTNFMITRKGFSVGLEDCYPNPKSTEVIEKKIYEGMSQAKMVMNSDMDNSQMESKISSILNGITDIGEKIVSESINANNNFMHMISSGSKGKMFNYVNSVNAVGQQNLQGRRVPQDCGGRSLPCYVPIDQLDNVLDSMDNRMLIKLFERNGFIKSSFYDGLNAAELFFLAAGGREGLSDTAVKTSRCGYTSKRLLKLMEDLKIGYNSMVVNAKGNVIQFCYGDDNYSGSELIKTNYGYQCVDVAHIVDELNADIEWSNGL